MRARTLSDGGRGRLALGVVLVLVVLAGCAGASNDAGAPTGLSGAGGGDSGGAQSATSLERGTGPPGVGSFYGQDGDRVVVREGNMRVRVENFSEAFLRLRAIAARNGGYLGDRSQRSEGEWDAGTVTVRVPPENFSGARDDVATLGTLENENVRVRDFTAESRTREAQIESLEAEERALLQLLNRTDSVEDAERIRADLREVRERIHDLEREQRSLNQRETLSTIRVDMHEPEDRKPPENFESAFGFTDAFLQAFYGGMTAVKYVIVFVGYAVPIGLAVLPLGAFGIALFAGLRRVRRTVERVVGGRPSSAGGGPALGGEAAGDTPDRTDQEPADDVPRDDEDSSGDGTDAPE